MYAQLGSYELGFGTKRPVVADQTWTKCWIGVPSVQLDALATYRLRSRVRARCVPVSMGLRIPAAY